MAKDRIGVVKGTFLIPGVSKNNRLYTKENISTAVEGMQEKLSAGSVPLTMYSSHSEADKDSSLQQVGRITKVAMDDTGRATFEADIADTTVGRDLAALVTPKSPYLKGISIRGAWLGDLTTVEHKGKKVSTSDKLQVTGIDFTGRPGVEGAEIAYAKLMESAGLGDFGVTESSDESLTFFTEEDDDLHDRIIEAVTAALEEATKKPHSKVKYADPGYNGTPSYPIDTAERVRYAWSSINQEKNQESYTATQVARIKTKIKSAAGKYGIKIAAESDQLIADMQELLESYLEEAGASMSIYNGTASINVSGYTDDAGKLPAVAKRLAMAAMAALMAVDPDMDGDIDLDTGDSSSSGSEAAPKKKKQADGTETPDDDEESASTCKGCGAGMVAGDMACPQCGVPVQGTETSAPINTEAQVGTDNSGGPTEAATIDYAKLAEEIVAAQLKAADEAKVLSDAKAAEEAAAKAEADAKAAADIPTQDAAPESAGVSFAQAVEMAAQAAAKAIEVNTAKMEESFTARLQEEARKTEGFRKGFSDGGSSFEGKTLESMTPKEVAVLHDTNPHEFYKLAGEALMETSAIQALTLRQVALGSLRIAQ